MKNIFTLFLIFGLSQLSLAQQSPQYSLYMLNKFNFNPAYAGLDNSLSLTGVYRKQWSGLTGAPISQSVNAHMPFYFASGGVGIAVENETFGAWQHTSFNFSYNYQMTIGKAGVLSLGASGGIVQRSLDGSELRTPDGDYLENNFIHNDVELPNGMVSGLAPNFNFGAYFQGEKLEIGISALNLTEQLVDLDGNLKFQLDRSYYLNVGYNMDIGRKWRLTPSVLLKTDISQTQIDFSAILKYNDNIFGGASFRGYNTDSIDAVALLMGFKLSEKITLAYSFDMTLSNLNKVSDGSHEILLNYNLGKIIGKGKPPRIIYNPRNL